jgi:type VI secretion system protein ImpM
MSAALTGTIAADAPWFTAAGFRGKIPARGDFVRGGLPRSFSNPWDDWLERMLASSREKLGEAWVPAWLEGPVWRFALLPGLCGPCAVLGLWLPSVDRVGRYFPLTVAAVSAETDLPRLVRSGGGFLTAAERAGREALANDLPPEALAARIRAAAAAPSADPGIDPSHYPAAQGLWWTEGAPRVGSGAFAGDALPDGARFAAMLDASPAPSP